MEETTEMEETTGTRETKEMEETTGTKETRERDNNEVGYHLSLRLCVSVVSVVSNFPASLRSLWSLISLRLYSPPPVFKKTY